MPPKKKDDGSDEGKTYTEAEVRALIAKEVGKATGGDDIDVLAKRPYNEIYAKDGQLLCRPPAKGGGGGPIALNGEHPNDYYGVELNDDGTAKTDKDGHAIATKNV